jgi:hypothetical protein
MRKSPNTTTFTPAPTITVRVSPMAGRKMKAPDSAPPTAPNVLIAYSSPVRLPICSRVWTAYLVRRGSVAPINAVGITRTANAVRM